MASGITLLRIVVGGAFVGHGLQKLVGAFDGPGLDGVEQTMRHLELEPARAQAIAAASAETFGGAGLALGVGTPLAAAGLVGTMVTAVRKVHLQNGFWSSNGGWEFNAVLAAAALAVVADGPGRATLDGLVGRRRWGTGWMLFSLLAGVAGSFGATTLAARVRGAGDPHADAADV